MSCSSSCNGCTSSGCAHTSESRYTTSVSIDGESIHLCLSMRGDGNPKTTAGDFSNTKIMNIELEDATGNKRDSDVRFTIAADSSPNGSKVEWVGEELEYVMEDTVLTGLHISYFDDDCFAGTITTKLLKLPCIKVHFSRSEEASLQETVSDPSALLQASASAPSGAYCGSVNIQVGKILVWFRIPNGTSDKELAESSCTKVMNIAVENFTGAKWDADVRFRLVPDQTCHGPKVEWIGGDLGKITDGTVLTGVHIHYFDNDMFSGTVSTNIFLMSSVDVEFTKVHETPVQGKGSVPSTVVRAQSPEHIALISENFTRIPHGVYFGTVNAYLGKISVWFKVYDNISTNGTLTDKLHAYVMNVAVENWNGNKWDSNVRFDLVHDQKLKGSHVQWVEEDMHKLIEGTVLTGISAQYFGDDNFTATVNTNLPFCHSVHVDINKVHSEELTQAPHAFLLPTALVPVQSEDLPSKVTVRSVRHPKPPVSSCWLGWTCCAKPLTAILGRRSAEICWQICCPVRSAEQHVPASLRLQPEGSHPEVATCA
eukprot:gnl/TRDRNA2_/TRDRNA2_126356_c0_seq1.p1 gnl/TRDRNA2_/TRDRNA2_126356_c0~~gnl/TRDRNA2_/TRDRNA2_126356_c0_seq1.p1  ORF type:complete len:541 (+),score=53.68 gnl/TRDRNA2_/TRDRNA2_126356_c0_seq1:127-1749(+)